MSWTKSEIAELKRLASRKELFAVEIAEKLGRRPASVSWQLRRLKIDWKPRHRFGQWNVKHAHLREAALNYYQTHSREETAKRFKLTAREMQSLLTVAYRIPSLKHLRKDTRRHDAWTHEETLYFLRHIGLRETKWIAKRLKRGGYHAGKEHKARLHMSWAKQTHGLPAKWVKDFLQLELPSLKTKAGPTGPGVDCRYRIVPWVDIASAIDKSPRSFSVEVRACVRAMARFQCWLYGTKSRRTAAKRVRMAIQGRLR